MANTVSILSYANTFADWMVATNALAKENNDIAANNYVKPTGTLFLNAPTLGLQIANNAIVGGQLQVQGVGSSAYIQNNLRVDTQVYFTNTTIGLTNSGQANIGGPLLALGSNNGLQVANNAQINGSANVGGTLTAYGASKINNNFTVTGNTNNYGTVYTNYVLANTNITTATANVSTLIDANNANMFVNNLQTNGQLAINGNFVLNGTTVYNSNTFTINAGSSIGLNSSFVVNRGSSGANAIIRWNESSKVYQLNDVNTSTFYRIATDEYLNDTLTSTATNQYATANVANTLNNKITAAAATASSAAAAATNYFTTQSGSVAPTSGSVTITSSNGITTAGSGNTITINTPQDLRTTASPTFAGLTLGAPLAIAQGGTGATSAGAALTALLPTGTTAGYVLATGGPGNYYWAAGGTGGGGGATPGTTINSTYTQYTANGSTSSYNTPVYVPGADQLKVYFDGVRQFPGQYTETSGNTAGVGIVTFGSNVPSGTNVLLEVDGYSINPYYANNIAYTINSFISPSANTIQLAIDSFASKVSTYYANTIGSPNFSTVATGLTLNANTSNTAFATTAYVQAALNLSGNTFNHNISGNAGSVTNGVYSNGTYSNPSWITSIANTKITGTFPSTSITGLAASATVDTSNASNISTGTLSASLLPSSGVTAGTYGNSGNVATITVGSDGRVTSVSNTAIAQPIPGVFGQVFTSSGTFTIPANVTGVKVTVVGGGAGGQGGYTITTSSCSGTNYSYVTGAGGGGAGSSVAYLSNLTPGGTLSVTVGGAGGGGAGSGNSTFNGGSGGTSSVSSGTQSISTISATGGSGTSGGSSSGGSFNQNGGQSFGQINGSSAIFAGMNGSAYGSGGFGGSAGSGAGGSGKQGIVIFEW